MSVPGNRHPARSLISQEKAISGEDPGWITPRRDVNRESIYAGCVRASCCDVK